LKFAVLGRFVDPSAFDGEAVRAALQEAGLGGALTLEQARSLVHASVLPSFKMALEGFGEAAALAQRLDVPIIVHHSAPTMRAVLDLGRMGIRLVAAHANHNTFVADEAVKVAAELRHLGVTIDIAVLDGFIARRMGNPAELFLALLRAKVVDLISTDWAGGYHDPILVGPERAMAEGLIDLPSAVAMVTGNVAKAIPGLAPERGILAKGKVADITITSRTELSHVETVILGGQVVVDNGALVS
jgi:imidazolonepropionase-like amidohydrolase